jgi:hypothetical protein
MTLRFLIYLFLLLIISLYGVLNLKKLSTPYKILTFLIGITFLSECLSRLLIGVFHNSAPADHGYAITEFSLIAGIYYFLFKKVLFKRLVIISIPLFVMAEIINLVYFQTVFEFPSVLLSLQELACVVFSLFYFTEMLLNPIDVPLFKQSAFWLNTSLFSFSAIIFLCFGLMNSLIVNQIGINTLSTFIYWVNIIFYCVLWFSINIETKSKVSVQQ